MDIFLIGELVGIGDALVGLALVVEQAQLDHVAVYAAGRVDGVELVLHHLAVFLAVFGDHPHGSADPDFAVGIGGGHGRRQRQSARGQPQFRFVFHGFLPVGTRCTQNLRLHPGQRAEQAGWPNHEHEY